jgi:hypothetical protein
MDLLASRNDFTAEIDPTSRGIDVTRVLQYDVELVQRIGWRDEQLQTTYGASYRNATARSEQRFQGRGLLRNEIYRGFLQQSAELGRRLSLVGAYSLENLSPGNTEPAYQVALLFTAASLLFFRADGPFL